MSEAKCYQSENEDSASVRGGGRTKVLELVIRYQVTTIYHLPVEAKTYQPPYAPALTEEDSVVAYFCDHQCEPYREDCDEWHISSYEEVEE